ncbi:MAG TPA: aminoglycoside phosphotransferase family protein [Chitinophagaceae bacterium]
MKTVNYQEALDAFANPFHEFAVEQITMGLINHSYKATSKLNGHSFLLQQINHKVFSQPGLVQSNYEALWKFLQTEKIPFLIPEPKLFPDNTTLYVDSHDHYWRVFEFIEGGKTLDVPETSDQAKAVAQTFGSFTASFEDFDISMLHKTIPSFHDLSLRFKQFHQSIHSGHYDRLLKAAALINELKARDRYASFYDVIIESEAFSKRVIHHDAKISNILFDAETGNVICPVDFDTVMPGYFFSDLGDMIRSMASCKNENSIAFEELCIRDDFYKAIISGYLSVMEHQLSAAEKKYIHFSGLMMICMQAVRFLTDYLNGNIYYRIDYGEQNFDRAKNQLILLQQLEDFLLKEYNFKI